MTIKHTQPQISISLIILGVVSPFSFSFYG